MKSQVTKNRQVKQQTSQSAYAAEVTKSLELLAKLQEVILEKDCIGRNWAEVGDIRYINELLEQAVNFKTGANY